MSGGKEQAREPAQEIEPPAIPEPATTDPLGLGDDDADAALDKRAMDQSRALGTARSVYAMDAGSGRPNDLQLEL